MDLTRTEAVTREEVLRRATALVPVWRERAARTETARRVLDETVEEIFANELNLIAVPTRFGGLDVGYEMHLEVAAELARGCASSAWCYSLWGVHHYWLGWWPLETQEEVYANGPNVVICSTNYSTNASCEAVPGGYKLSGQWEFSSGCDPASWAVISFPTPGGRRTGLVPRSDFEIVDTWHVLGLCGTGSKDLVLKDVFVPEYRTKDRGALGGSDMTGWEIHRQRRYRMPMSNLTVWDLVAPMFGIAQAIVDEVFDRLRGSEGGGRTADSVPIQLRLTEAAAEIDAARALMRADLAEMLEKAGRGEGFSDLERARYQRDKAFCVELCRRAADRVFAACGAHALFQDDCLQRLFRDANALPHREGLTLDFAGENYARLRLGLPAVARR